MSHSVVLVVAYGAVCLIWWAASRLFSLWRDPVRVRLERPWREVGFLLVAVVCTLALGQLWQRGFRLSGTGAVAPLADATNQLLIFAPIIALPFIRRNGAASAWIQPCWKSVRIAVGVVLAMIAVGIYSALERNAESFPGAWQSIVRYPHLDEAVQVLLEDIAIAVAFVRIAAALGTRTAVTTVALLFAAAHIPAMLASGVTVQAFGGLVRDAGLGVLVIGTLWRGADILWFWPVHFALDMTQFIHRA